MRLSGRNYKSCVRHRIDSGQALHLCGHQQNRRTKDTNERPAWLGQHGAKHLRWTELSLAYFCNNRSLPIVWEENLDLRSHRRMHGANRRWL
jgi:hypothetical protein